MVAIWLTIGATVLVAFLVWHHRRTEREPRERPVLPAHYSSLLHFDRSRYPGLCAACGTENTPGYNVCKECGERLPGGTDTRTDMDVSQIFGE